MAPPEPPSPEVAALPPVPPEGNGTASDADDSAAAPTIGPPQTPIQLATDDIARGVQVIPSGLDADPEVL